MDVPLVPRPIVLLASELEGAHLPLCRGVHILLHTDFEQSDLVFVCPPMFLQYCLTHRRKIYTNTSICRPADQFSLRSSDEKTFQRFVKKNPSVFRYAGGLVWGYLWQVELKSAILFHPPPPHIQFQHLVLWFF